METELLNLVRHMQAYPSDSLEAALRNVFDFDVYRPETISKLEDILDHHGCVFGCRVTKPILTSKCSLAVKKLGIDAAREATKKQVLNLKFEPKGDTSLSGPKFGKEDPKNEAHTGGNTWAGGVSIDFFSRSKLLTQWSARPEDVIRRGSVAGVDICACSRVMTSTR